MLPTNTLDLPVAVAIDDRGNLYIADNGNHRVVKETLSGGNYTESVFRDSLNYPYGVTVDQTGTVYITDTYNNQLLAETPSGSGFTESVVATSSALNALSGVAVDGLGNIYIADTNNSRIVKEIFGASPVSFASTTAGTANATPQVVQVANFGNAPLAFSAVSFPSDFPEAGMVTGDCAATTTLSPGGQCSLTVTFAPNAPLNGNSSVVLTEGVSATTNSLNVPGTQQTVVATGTELIP